VLLLIAFGFGWVASSLHTQYWAKLKPAVGRALAAVFGRQPALASVPGGQVAATVIVEPNENPKQIRPTIRPFLSGISMPFGVPWRLIGCVAVAALVLGILYFYGESRYAEGAAVERGEWQQKYMDAQERARHAEYDLAMDRLSREQEAERLRVSREANLARVRQEIANAPDLEAQYAAYLAHRDSLRAQSAERLAGARTDYLSSIAPDA
jgi:hypothetical protein